jgi:hypothetical protein
MRHYEFIVEYNTQATVKAMGNKIIDALMLPQVLQALMTAVHNKHSQDSMKREPYYIFYRGNDFGDHTHYTFKNPTNFLNSVNMTIPRPSLMEFQSLAALKLISYVHEFAVKKMKQDPRDSSWKNTVEQAWREGSKKLEKEIVSDVIKILESFDPTPNKQYTLQIVKWFLDNGSKAFPKIEDGRSTLKEYLYYFQKLKARIPEQYRDIRQYRGTREFMDSVQYFKEKYGKKEKLLPKGNSDIIYQTKDVIVRHARDQEAACYLGQGTQWCTASTQADNYFENYDSSGPLVIINFAKSFIIGINKDDYGEDLDPRINLEKRIQKIQMHFTEPYDEDPDDKESFDSENWEVTQIADEQDNELDFGDLYYGKHWYGNGVDEYESPFREMWDDSKFQHAIDKVWQQWRVEHD